MSKYIDADKLIAEIERLAETLPEIRSTMEGLLSFVESLEKEQDVTFRERSILIDAETAITSLQQELPVISDTDKSNLRDVPAIIRTSNHPFKENLALTIEKYIK